jgi:hypothetical protein
MSEEETKPPVNIAYGALYMKKGEPIDRAYTQIKNVSKKQPYAWFFDIICTPNQIEAARTNAADLYARIADANLDMPEDKMIVGITVSEKLRPAMTVMQRLSQQVAGEDLLLGMQKYFDDRRMFLWIGGQPQHQPYEEAGDEATAD